MSHTPEPWIYGISDDESGLCFEVTKDGYYIATTHDGVFSEHTAEANARRIVACVNACAGIPDDMVSHVVAFGLQGHNKVSEDNATLRAALQTHAEEAAKLIGQRDELVDALGEYANYLNWAEDDELLRRVWLEPGSKSPEAYNGFELARAAITNATQPTNHKETA